MEELHWLEACIGALFGLLIGSFLNVVIYRLPKMMERQWAAECADFVGQAPAELAAAAAPDFNLLVPRSACQHCGHQIRWYENIPLLSYALLRGKCSACGARISPRYPAVEVLTGALFFFCCWRWGISVTGFAWCAFSAIVLALALIDWDTTLLPDDMTLPLVWAGLLAATFALTPVTLPDAVLGAVGGYLSLWLVYWAFKLLTAKEGMGYGDFKLFAALGAWFGWQALVPIILMASVIGAIVGIAMKFASTLREGGYVPFGPFLAGAGLTAMVFGPQAILHAVGL